MNAGRLRFARRTVNQVTVAGNCLTLLNSIVEVGSNTEFGFSRSGGYVGSPPLWIKSLSVGGK